MQAVVAILAGAAGHLRAQPAAVDGSRVALVIGNNAYSIVPLANAANDAKLMAEVLTGAGFKVDAQIDADGASMGNAVREFGAAIAQPQVKLAIFYFAGHGLQVEWRNFLLPTDAIVRDLKELGKRSFDLGMLLDVLPKARDKTFVIILDACRDNPFGDSFRPERKGLSQFDAPVGSLIAFSTSPGSVAADAGSGRNGLYTENLARELRVKGLRIEDVFKRVRVNVSLASRGAQIPWESTSLVGDIYIAAPQAPPSEEELERRFEEEVAFWNRVKGSKDPADWAALLHAFPNGKLCEIAQARLNMLLARAAPGAARSLARHEGIALGPGLPVPDFLGRSANPHAAGTYPLDRRFNVGDRAVYVATDPHGETQRIVRRVTSVDIDGDRVELNGGRFVTDLMGNVVKKENVEFEIPVQIAPAELQVGRRWTARFRSIRRNREFDEDLSAQVVARELIKVPAGEFDAFRIEMRMYGVQKNPGTFGRAMFARETDRTFWEVPGLNFAVKIDFTVRLQSGTLERRLQELESLRQKE
jgi:uncharacterized caspase-like protein